LLTEEVRVAHFEVTMLKQYLTSPLCLKCGSFFCDDSLFCLSCFKKEIINRCEQECESHLGDIHFYLMNWLKTDPDFLTDMAYRLKSDNSKPAWQFYSQLFYEKHKDEIEFKKYSAIVPIPSSNESSVHAMIFAKNISNLSGAPVIDVLYKKAQSSDQKTLSAEQRKRAQTIERKSQLNEQFTNCLFVDDILTTGESFLQSKKALNASGESLILSLFYRPKAL
jgi:predicted amidophosphoribosyltransferase